MRWLRSRANYRRERLEALGRRRRDGLHAEISRQWRGWECGSRCCRAKRASRRRRALRLLIDGSWCRSDRGLRRCNRCHWRRCRNRCRDRGRGGSRRFCGHGDVWNASCISRQNQRRFVCGQVPMISANLRVHSLAVLSYNALLVLY